MAAPEPTPAPAPERVRTPLATILAYTAPAVGVGFMFFLVNLYLMKFATDVLLIAPGAMGLIFGISRLWDGISDPLAGYWSDRTRTPLGRRRPWMLASLVPAIAVFLMVWSPPAALEGRALVPWMAVGVLGFYTAFTIFSVPHASLGAELSLDYDERNRIFGWRHVSFMAGAFLAIGAMRWLIASPDPRATARTIAWAASALLAVLMLISVARVRERREFLGRGARRPLRAFRDVLRNPHARGLLLVILIENVGASNITILTPYASEYLIRTPGLTPLYLLCYLLAATLTVPLWVRLARRFGKRELWRVAMVVSGCSFGGMFLGGPGDWLWIASLATLAGVAGGCGPVVAPSMQSDVIDYDEYRTGERKEGTYFAAFSFVFKGTAGLTLAMTGIVLQLAGFQPNVEQTPTAKFAIRSLFALLPLLSYWTGAWLLSRYRLDRVEHTRIRAAVNGRGADPPGRVQ